MENSVVPVVNGKRKSEPDVNVILEEDEETPIPEEIQPKSVKGVDSKREKQKRISFKGKTSFKKWLKL